MFTRNVVRSDVASKSYFSAKALIAKVMTLVVAMAGFIVLDTGQAMASHLNCGDTITTDTRLVNDLVNCPNQGIIIGADDITLDLNGHTVDGDGTPVDPCPENEPCDVGVDNLAGHDGFTIRGGTIQQFGVGIYSAGGAADSHLHRLAVRGNTEIGILVEESTDSVVAKSSMSHNGIVGLVVVNSRRALISRNSLSGSDGYVMFLYAVHDSRVQKNVLKRNAHGIALVGGSAGNTLRMNLVTHSDGSSIDIGEGAEANRVSHNRLIDNGDGIILTDAFDNLISHNRVTGTGFFGAPDTGGFGILLDGGARNSLTRNIVTGGRGPAIYVTLLEAPSVAKNHVISHNLATSNRKDGILVDSGAKGTLIEHNTLIRNGDDGIDVNVPATTLTRNTANRNHDLGIEAVRGIIDGGGNHAAGNGDPAQCTHIDCK
jgi:large repetitive protein